LKQKNNLENLKISFCLATTPTELNNIQIGIPGELRYLCKIGLFGVPWDPNEGLMKRIETKNSHATVPLNHGPGRTFFVNFLCAY
jgi:hypothetical protein